MKALRKKAAAMGIIPSPTPVTNSAQTVIRTQVKKTEVIKFHGSKKSITDNSKQTIKEEDGSEQAITPPETSDDALAPTPATPTTKKTKVINGRVKKPRASPRKTVKKDYKKMEDPFVEMEDVKDENGENVFSGPEESGSEDTVLTDGEFETAAEEEVIKVEEEA